MKILYIIIALAAVPLVFLTMYLRTNQGIKQRLGSFFIIRKIRPDFLKVRSIRDILLLLLRLAFAVLILLLVVNPSDVEAPGRKAVFHEAGKNEAVMGGGAYSLRLVAPAQTTDRFDEDLFFIKAFINNYKMKSGNASVIYNPSEKTIDSLKGNAIIFPHRKQAGNAFLKWIELFDFASLQNKETKIKDAGVAVRACYPIMVAGNADVKKLAMLDDGTVLAVSFVYKNARVLLFGAGLSGYWGDIGVSGWFADIIDGFLNNITVPENNDKEIKKDNDPHFGQVKSLLSFGMMLKLASVVFILELLLFIFRTIRLRKIMPIVFILLFSVSLYAEDFKFIELTPDGKPANTAMFLILRHELEEKTSVRISPDYYAAHSANALIQGKLPELPYLWITGCAVEGAFTDKLVMALSDFVDRGGIIFIDIGGTDAPCRQFYEGLALKAAGSPGLVRLPDDHPLYKSFFLLNSQRFSGADVSITTRRTAIILSENNLTQKILQRNDEALKTGVNIVLYMLSGNYKSDQIHTRQILNRLKKRELFR